MNNYQNRNFSRRSQKEKLRQIELIRLSRKWLKRVLIAVSILLAVAVALSYLLINRESEPNHLEVPEKGFHGVL